MDKNTKVKNYENIVARMVLGDEYNYYHEKTIHSVAKASLIQNDAIKTFARCYKTYKENFDKNGVNIIANISKNNRFDVSNLSDVQKEDYRRHLID